MKKIAKDVFQISVMPRNSINCYLIEDVLIDAGIRSSANKILKEIKGFDVNSHAITHAHHQGSSKEVCEQLNIPFFLVRRKRQNPSRKWFSNRRIPQSGQFNHQELNRKFIKKLADLKPKILCFGHGPVLIDKGELVRFLGEIT